MWYKHGKLHKQDGPAVTSPSGYHQWWVNGKEHRVDGPAQISPDGSESWYINGKLHRIGAPASFCGEGIFEWWYQNGKLHREDGPAGIFNPEKRQEWYIKGKLLTEIQVRRRLKRLSLPEISESIKMVYAPEPPKLKKIKIWESRPSADILSFKSSKTD